MIVRCKRTAIRSLAILASFLTSAAVRAQPPIDADWKANAKIDNLRVVSDEQLGAAQGVSYRQDRLYFYGDVYSAKPRVGIIREYTLDLKPTGRDIRLARNGKPLILHPTGLTWDAEYGCFLGDTVNKVATIYKLDWDRALKDGNLDAAVLAEIRDDAATNGCRPEYVTVQGRRLLATADYGDVRPAVRLYDPRRLVEARRSTAPGVCVATIPCDPFNQNLFWDATTGEAYVRTECGCRVGLETRRLRSAKGGGRRQVGEGPGADAHFPAAQRTRRLAAAARRPRGVRDFESEGQHLRRQEQAGAVVFHARGHEGVFRALGVSDSICRHPYQWRTNRKATHVGFHSRHPPSRS